MRSLRDGAGEYDAVWPASSIWLSLGDTGHLIKHSQSVSLTPVVFGIRQSPCRRAGICRKRRIRKRYSHRHNRRKMTFCMTSATQSNSGASAYIGFPLCSSRQAGGADRTGSSGQIPPGKNTYSLKRSGPQFRQFRLAERYVSLRQLRCHG